MTTLSLIEAGITTAKTIMEGSKIAAESALMSAEMQFKIAAGIANSVKESIKIEIDGKSITDFININVEGELECTTTPASEQKNMLEEGDVIENKTGAPLNLQINLPTEAGSLFINSKVVSLKVGGKYTLQEGEWREEIVSSTAATTTCNWEIGLQEGAELDAFIEKMGPADRDTFNNFKDTLDQTKSLMNGYIAAKETLLEITESLDGIIADLEEFHVEAKQTMEELFQSPYLLPGLWAALLPSMMPYGGGIIPPPFYIGPPSTVPGMIYLILLLIDAIEDKQHRDNLESPDCDQL